MGVKGLTSLLKQRKLIAQRTHPEEPIPGLVVDGYAFAFQLYVRCTPSMLAGAGGSYQLFHQQCCEQLQALSAQNVPLFFVIDGVAPMPKKPTQISREAKKIAFVEQMLRGPKKIGANRGGDEVVAPLLFERALCDALRESGVEFIVTKGEGDQVTASTAAERQWYVLSNDSDFAIYNTPGYVPMDSLVFNEEGVLEYGFVTKELLAAELLQGNLEMLPFWATLCGNDYEHADQISQWQASLGPAKKPLDVLMLVANFVVAKDMDSAIAEVAEGQLAELSDFLKISVQRYSAQPQATEWELQDGRPWPQWLIKAHQEGSLGLGSRVALSAEFWCTTSVESCREACFWQPSTALREAICSILYPQGGEALENRRKDFAPTFAGKNMPFKTAESAQLPALENVDGLSQEVRRNAILGCLIPSQSSTVMELLTESGLSEELFLAVLSIGFTVRQWPKQANGKPPADLKRMCLMIAAGHLGVVKETTEDFEAEAAFRRPSWWKDECISKMERLSQLHATLSCANTLNTLLQEPLSPLEPHRLLAGVQSFMAFSGNGELQLTEEVVRLAKTLYAVCQRLCFEKAKVGASPIAGGTEWHGEATYDGESDKYVLKVTESVGEDGIGKGTHILFGQEEQVTLTVTTKGDAMHLSIADADSQFFGRFAGRCNATLKGKTYEVEDGEREEKGRFWIEQPERKAEEEALAKAEEEARLKAEAEEAARKLAAEEAKLAAEEEAKRLKEEARLAALEDSD